MSDDDRPDDPLPALQAELDQMLAMAPELARVIKGYFDVFKGEGFTESQALYLAVAQVQQSPGTAP